MKQKSIKPCFPLNYFLHSSMLYIYLDSSESPQKTILCEGFESLFDELGPYLSDVFNLKHPMQLVQLLKVAFANYLHKGQLHSYEEKQF